VGIQRLLGPTLARLGPIPQFQPALVCACVAAGLIASLALASDRAASTGLQRQQAANAAPANGFAATKVVSARQVATNSIDVDARHRIVMRATYDLPWPCSADHLTLGRRC
jgi:hypothetical protein